MKARRMIFEDGFGPDDVVFLTDALEGVWAETMADRLLNGLDQSAERERLASIIITLGRHRTDEAPDKFRSRVKNAFLGRSQLSADAAE